MTRLAQDRPTQTCPTRFARTVLALLLPAVAGLALSGCSDGAPMAPAPAPAGESAPTAAAPAADLPAGVAASADQIHPLLTGATLPAITVLDPEKKAVDLNAVVRAKPTVLIVFRGGWCPYCNRHLQAMQDAEPALLALGYQVIAITADTPDRLPADAAKDGVKYALYSDPGLAAARALGLAFRLDPATVAKYRGWNIDLVQLPGRSDGMLPVPAAYVLNQAGVIEYEYVNPDFRVRADTDVLLAAAKAALKPPLGKPSK
ncbi:MAG: peroxiredoxin-like family protein [Planctomycetota bacterium]